jgi:hypothetical protein
MPTRWTLRLRTPAAAPRAATPGQLHGLACALLEGAGADHNHQTKPFAVSPLLTTDPTTQLTELRIGWLDDQHPCDLTPLARTRVRLGSQ